MGNLTVKAARIDLFSVTQGLHLHPSKKYSSINLLYTNYIIMVILNSNLDTYCRRVKTKLGQKYRCGNISYCFLLRYDYQYSGAKYRYS